MGSDRRPEKSPRWGSSAAAQVIASNEELLTELLLRLPIKSLLKFKCVCERWRSLITDPYFIRRKYLKSSAVSALYLECRRNCHLDLDCYPFPHGDGHYELVPLDPSENWVTWEHFKFADNPGFIEIEQSCNGLLLCRSWEERKHLVYNPTTKQSIILPPHPPVPRVRAMAKMEEWGPVLAFDPSKSPFYKVVCMLRCGSSFQFLIYSSETGRWRVSDESALTTPLQSGVCSQGLYCNDAIHWDSGTDDASLYFDMNEELVQEMAMPPEYSDVLYRYFGESRDRLYLLVSSLDLTIHLNVYEMERDRSGWFLKFRVDQGGMGPDGRLLDAMVVYVARGEKEEDLFMVLYMNHKVIRYNFRRQTHQELYDLDFETSVIVAYPHMESLSLV